MILVLLAAAAATSAEPTAPAQPAKPKMICRSYDVTGSLVQKQRVCRPAESWAKAEDNARSELERLKGPLPGGGGPQ